MKKIFAALAGIALATAAYATVTFNPVDGTGFVGKGDVQLALGLNNAQLQAQAGSLAFTFNAVDTYDAECYWETETGKGTVIVHDITVPKQVSVNDTVQYDARTHKQVDGFILTGFGTIVSEGTVPVVGAACPGNNPGTIITVTPTGEFGALYVNGVLLQ